MKNLYAFFAFALCALPGVAFADIFPLPLSVELIPHQSSYAEGEKIVFTVLLKNQDDRAHPVLLPGDQNHGQKLFYFRIWYDAGHFVPVAEESREIIYDGPEKMYPRKIMLAPGDSIWFKAYINSDPHDYIFPESNHRLGALLAAGTYKIQGFYDPQGTGKDEDLYEYFWGSLADQSTEKTLMPMDGLSTQILPLEITPARADSFIFEEQEYRVIKGKDPLDSTLTIHFYYTHYAGYNLPSLVKQIFWNGDVKLGELTNYYRYDDRNKLFSRGFTYALHGRNPQAVGENSSYYAKSFALFYQSGNLMRFFRLDFDKCPRKTHDIKFTDGENKYVYQVTVPDNDGRVYSHHYSETGTLTHSQVFGIYPDTTAVMKFYSPYTGSISNEIKYTYTCDNGEEPVLTQIPEPLTPRSDNRVDTVIDGGRYRYRFYVSKVVSNDYAGTEYGDSLTDGLKQGYWITVSNGNILKKENYINGSATGSATEYYHNNFPYSAKFEGMQVNGLKTGEWMYSFKKTHHSKKWVSNSVVGYDRYGNEVYNKSLYKNGKVASILFYLDGKTHDKMWQKKFDKKGRLIYDGPFVPEIRLLLETASKP